MTTIKHLFIINESGFPIVSRSFLEKYDSSIVSNFYKRYISSPAPPPVFRLNGLNYAYISTRDLIFICIADDNSSPTLLTLLLRRISTLIADYCGKCSEDFINRNVSLVYEIIEELLPFGRPQSSEADELHSILQNVAENPLDFCSDEFSMPLAVKPSERAKLDKKVCLVINEKLVMLFSGSGELLKKVIAGYVYTRSFIPNKPGIQIKFKDLDIDSNQSIDVDYSFQPFVNAQEFKSNGCIQFNCPIGTCLLFAYRTNQFRKQPPFTLIVTKQDVVNAKSLKYRVDIMSKFPKQVNAINVCCSFQYPVETTKTIVMLGKEHRDDGCKQDYTDDSERRVLHWNIPMFGGEKIYSANFSFHFDDEIRTPPEELIGPISLSFTINDYLASNITIDDFKIISVKGASPYTKLSTTSDSYVYDLRL